MPCDYRITDADHQLLRLKAQYEANVAWLSSRHLTFYCFMPGIAFTMSTENELTQYNVFQHMDVLP